MLRQYTITVIDYLKPSWLLWVFVGKQIGKNYRFSIFVSHWITVIISIMLQLLLIILCNTIIKIILKKYFIPSVYDKYLWFSLYSFNYYVLFLKILYMHNILLKKLWINVETDKREKERKATRC